MVGGYWLVPLALIMVIMGSDAIYMEGVSMNKKVKTATYLTPMFTTTPGIARENFYYNIDFPKGHIAIKAFDGEVVDEAGNSLPIYDAYLHHRTLVRYYQHKDIPDPDRATPFVKKLQEPGFIIAGNKGVCQDFILPHYYGIGAETRKTSTYIQDPYGIEVGNPLEVPPRYEEKWVFNVHVIDIRGVEDKMKCGECWCEVYNATVDQYGEPIEEGYTGGMECCYDNTQCRLSKTLAEGLKERNLFLKYTVLYMDWDDSILPLKLYSLDVTDTWKLSNPSQEHNCILEYSIEACFPTNEEDDKCSATKRVKLTIPSGGYLIYAVSHQHTGSVGATLYGEDGRVLCSSNPIYGQGNEVGNEKGYVVGMQSCNPKPGSVKIKDGEVVTFESNYVPGETHRGVMGIFNIMVSDRLPLEPSIRMEPSQLARETME